MLSSQMNVWIKIYILCIVLNYRTYFGTKRIQKRLSDGSDDDDNGDDGEEKPAQGSKPTRRKATDILAEVRALKHPAMKIVQASFF